MELGSLSAWAACFWDLAGEKATPVLCSGDLGSLGRVRVCRCGCVCVPGCMYMCAHMHSFVLVSVWSVRDLPKSCGPPSCSVLSMYLVALVIQHGAHPICGVLSQLAHIGVFEGGSSSPRVRSGSREKCC